MVKVQNGWESHSIEQLEKLPARASAPSTPITQSPYSHRRGISGGRRQSLYSEASDRYIHSPGTQTSPGMLPPYASSALPTSPWQQSPVYHTTSNGPSNGPTLAPAAPISSGRYNRRSLSSRAPPNLIMSRTPQGAYHGQSTTPTSTTPVRQGILRMPSGQAEKDALETLLFMSSPNNSSNAKFSAPGTADPSPLRSEFSPAAKRVIFEHR
jgi:hypothetical protein